MCFTEISELSLIRIYGYCFYVHLRLKLVSVPRLEIALLVVYPSCIKSKNGFMTGLLILKSNLGMHCLHPIIVNLLL